MDITKGMIIGNFKVLKDLGVINKRRMYEIECVCGKIYNCRSDVLQDSRYKSCGCQQYQLKPTVILNKRYGKLCIIKDLGMKKFNKRSYRYVRCKCDCGNIKDFQLNNLKHGTKSCGCATSEARRKTAKNMSLKNIKHGMSKTRLYNTWLRMIHKCYNPKHPKFKWYGYKGIRVCDDWKESFDSFKEWAYANGYTDAMTIDRLDVMGNYEPSNCQWISLQANIDKEFNLDRKRWRSVTMYMTTSKGIEIIF